MWRVILLLSCALGAVVATQFKQPQRSTGTQFGHSTEEKIDAKLKSIEELLERLKAFKNHLVSQRGNVNSGSKAMNVPVYHKDPTRKNTDFKSVSISSYSSNSNINGKRSSHRRGKAVVNDNGHITTYNMDR